MSESERVFLGIDMGATNIRYAVVEAGGRIRRSESERLPSESDARVRVPRRIVEAFAGEVAGVGLAVAGTVRGGVLGWSASLGLHDVDFGGPLSELGAGPVAVLNDARAAGLAEALVGGGRDVRSVLSLTVGTGIGGALVFDGRLHTGTGDAGEVGHMVIDPAGPPCTCGRSGCWERFAGGRALQERAEAIFPTSAAPLQEMLAEAELGTGEGVRAVECAARSFALGVDNLCAVLAPDAIVLGGGIVARDGVIARRYRQALESTRWAGSGSLRASMLGDAAGQIGAALAAEQLVSGT